ncbi:peptidoglycan-binding domain-containing protein [Micromonospora echinospora]
MRTFQSSKGLYVDGVVGPITWTALILPLQQGNSGDLVRGLQTALNARGASVVVDGAFGAQTTTAVRNFQSSRGLVVDGLVGPVTWSTLI